MKTIEGVTFKMAAIRATSPWVKALRKPSHLPTASCGACDASDEPSLLLAASLAAPKARREEEKGAIAKLRRLRFVEE